MYIRSRCQGGPGWHWDCPALTSAPFCLELRGLYYKPLMCLGRGSLGPPKDAGVEALTLEALLSVSPCSMVRSGCWMGLSALCSPVASVLSSSSEEEKSWCKRRVEKLRPVSGPSGCRTPNCEGSSSQKQGANDQRTFSHLLCCAFGPAWMGLEGPLLGKPTLSGGAGRSPSIDSISQAFTEHPSLPPSPALLTERCPNDSTCCPEA